MEKINELKISSSGLSIYSEITGKIIAKYPGKVVPLDDIQFKEWIENAEIICNLYNLYNSKLKSSARD